ncbi:MAG: hypothetical protein JSV79_12130, partial [Armatimonadota bacterium]
GREIALGLVYLALGLTSAWVWSLLADVQSLPRWHMDMVLGSAPAPNQYRPLTPWLAEGVARGLVQLGASPAVALFYAYLLLRGVVTGLGLFFFDRYLRVWFSGAGAASGALCLAAILPFTYQRVVQESDPINLLVFVLAFWAIARERDLALIPLVAVGTLNRETTAMIPALYLLARWGQRPGRDTAWKTAAIGGAWLAVYGALRLGYGSRDYYCDVLMWSQNWSSWVPTVQVLLVFGALWVLAFLGARHGGPTMLRRALWLVPPYVALHYVVAMADEVRLFLPLAPVLIPLSWCVLFPEARHAPLEQRRSEARR